MQGSPVFKSRFLPLLLLLPSILILLLFSYWPRKLYCLVYWTVCIRIQTSFSSKSSAKCLCGYFWVIHQFIFSRSGQSTHSRGSSLSALTYLALCTLTRHCWSSVFVYVQPRSRSGQSNPQYPLWH